jgi:DNA repair photolyase
MLPVDASKLLIVEGVEDDPRMRARAERLRRGVRTDDVRHVGDEELAAIVREELTHLPRNGMRAEFQPVVIFNRFRLDDDQAERGRRAEAFPELNPLKLNGYGGFDWRDSGSPGWREKTGLVCQPAWQLHTIVGCHFRCAYCNLSRFLNVMLNMEDFVSRLDGWIERCPRQTLFQYDNFTDTVCFEPEYGGAKLLIDYFARKPGQTLELYVGKSDHVDFLLDYDHRGQTVCCWSVSAATQSREFEWRSAPTEDRIESMRKCQAAGYPVRVRFSPIIPVAGWREENRAMIERLFRDVRPDVVTIETIRFLTYEAMSEQFDLAKLDPKFVQAMKDAEGQSFAQGCEVPERWRREVYDFFFGELDRVAPDVPVAFCREERTLWDHYEEFFTRRGQGPDNYICNCGPTSAPATVAGAAG